MKFTIEVEDFWIEDGTIKDALVSHIKHEVVTQIMNQIREDVKTKITSAVSQEITNHTDFFIKQKISEVAASSKLTINGKEIAIEEHLKNVFLGSNQWNSPMEYLKKTAESCAKEIRSRYDLAFASQIVLKMNENGLLKDDAAKLLLK